MSASLHNASETMKSNKNKALRFIAGTLFSCLVLYLTVGLLIENYVAALWVPVLHLTFVSGYLAIVGKRWFPAVTAGMREIAASVTRRGKPAA